MIALWHIVVICLVQSSTADTILPNPLRGTLHASNSPYVSEEDIQVPPGETLTIQRGTVIKFAPGKGLDVHGKISIESSDHDIVQFTRWDEKKTVLRPPLQLNTRIVDEDAPGRGTLLVYRNRKWQGICLYRMSDKTWNQNIAKVVCGSLGFIFSPHAEIYAAAKAPPAHSYSSFNSILCSGREKEITNCRFRSGRTCNHHLAVDCKSVYPGGHWRGIHIHKTSPSSSVLQHVIIDGAGVRQNGGTHHELTPSLFVNGSQIQISEVKVSNSAQNGVELENVNAVNLDHITATENRQIGIRIKTQSEKVQLQYINTTGNLGDGLVLERTPLVSFTGIQFCDVKCIRCEHTAADFPLRFTAQKPARKTPFECEKTFTTGPDDVLAFRVISASYNVEINLRDGSLINSPFVWNSKVANTQWSNPMPTIITTKTSITIGIKFTYYRFDEHVHFELLSGKADSFDITMKHMTSSSNRGNGLRVLGIRMPITISQSFFTHNQNGTFLDRTSSDVKFNDVQAVHQDNSGISTSDSDGWISMENTTLSHNKFGMFYSKSHTCKRDSVEGRYAVHMFVNGCTFGHNMRTGLQVTSYCRVNVTVESSNFTNNGLGSSVIHNNDRSSAAVHIVVLKDNLYSLNKRSVFIGGVGSLELRIAKNHFFESSGYALKVQNKLAHSYVRRNVYFITNNTFLNNNATFDSLVSIVVLSKKTDNKDIDFVWNYLQGNTYVRAEKYFTSSLQSSQAILHIETGTNADLHHNIFDNPRADVQLFAADKDASLIQQAHHCYWGTTSITDIANRIIGNHNALGYSKVQFSPFLKSKDFNDIQASVTKEIEFIQGSYIGGYVYGTVELKDTTKPYTVNKNIVIPKGHTLSILPGVTLEFEVGRSIFVQGKLHIEGTHSNKVYLGLPWDENLYRARLYPNTNALQGIMQVKMGNQWYSICSNKTRYRSMDKDQADFLCQVSGHEKSEGSSQILDRTAAATSIVNFDCPENAKHLGACTFQKNFICPEGYVFQVKCSPSHWSGIHFSYDADRSTLKHVHIAHVGHKNIHEIQAVIQSDVHRHQFEYIKITNTRNHYKTVGIKILKVAVSSDYVLSDLSMPDFNHRGKGIVSHDSRISLSDIRILNNHSRYDHGIYINPSMVPVTSLNHETIPTVCSNETQYISGETFRFARVRDQDIDFKSECELFVTTEEDRKISVQVISGRVGTSRNCGRETLMYHDGHKNDSEPEGVKADTNGYLWTSTGNEAHIIMRRMHHYRYSCMDLIILISSFKESDSPKSDLNINGMKLTGFSYGIYLESVWNNATFTSLDISSGSNGLYSNGGGQMKVISSNISHHRNNGLTLNYFKGSVMLNDTVFLLNKLSAILVNNRRLNNEKLRLTVAKCLMKENKVGISFNEYYRYYGTYIGNASFYIIDNSFINNGDGILSKFGQHYTTYQVNLTISGNRFTNNYRSITYENQHNIAQHLWNITNNILTFSKGHVLNIKGSGIIQNNRFMHSTCIGLKGRTKTFERDNIFINATGELLEFSGNSIINNTMCPVLVRIECDAMLCSILDNTIKENEISASLLEFLSKNPTNKVKPVIMNNILQGNKALSCGTKAISISGTRQVRLTGNILNNPALTFEFNNDLSTINDTLQTDATMNFWGAVRAENILQRIKDGRQKKWTSITKYSPFYINKHKNLTATSIFEHADIQNEHDLSGRMTRSVTLTKQSRNYILMSDLIITKGVTLAIEHGVSLLFTPRANLLVYGQLLVQGTAVNPVRLKLIPATQSTSCNMKYVLRLAGGTKHGGILQFLRGGTWYPFCQYEWSEENSRTACSQLGFGSPTKLKTNVKYSSTTAPVKFSFRCEGDELNLAECPTYSFTRYCNYRHSVKIACEETGDPIRFMSDISQEQSVMRNLVITNLAGIHVTGTPPIFNNVKIFSSREGVKFLGSGPINEKDISMTKLRISSVNSNGISLFDITSNVTMEQSLIKSTSLHGIHVSPVLDTGNTNMTSTLRFCDASESHYINPGETYHFFTHDASPQYGCRRWIETDHGFSIILFVRSTSTSRNIVATFYEGDEIGSSQRIGTFKGSQKEMTIQTLGNKIVAVIHQREQFISYSMLSVIPAKPYDCSFEEGMCGWNDYVDPFTSERGTWNIYDCSNGSHADFKGIAHDVNYPEGNEGHYIYAGVNSKSCRYTSARNKQSETAILQGPSFNRNIKLCFMSFSHYRSLSYYYRAERLTLFKKTSTESVRLWSSTTLNKYNKWIRETVSLDTKGKSTDYTLFFHVKYMKDCSNSVGLDNIKFEPCPIEKLVSTIRVTDTLIEDVPGRAIFFKNTDPEKHNVIWIERVAMEDIKGMTSSGYSTVSLDLKSAYVLIRNCDIMDTDKLAFWIKFNSTTSTRICEATIAQNKIDGAKSGGVISAKNAGVNNAKLWIRGNIIQHNSALDKFNTFEIENCSLTMEKNIIYNNTGKAILFINDVENAHIKHQLLENTFWFNSAQGQPVKYTVLLRVHNLEFHGNIFNNPSNAYEITAQKVTSAHVDGRNNWWGTGLVSSVSQRIRDGSSIIGIPVIQHTPFLRYPPDHFGLTSSCPFGWNRRGPYCLMYNVGAVTYSQAVSQCQKDRSIVLNSIRFKDRKYLQDLTSYRDVDGTTKQAVIWINPAICMVSTNQYSCPSCSVYSARKWGSVQNAKSCDELHPFICKKLSIELCKNGCFQQGTCVGKTCVCKEGWESDDCSKFHCRDVSNCSGRGDCVGANSCKCRPGWIGRACSKSYCDRFKSCQLCSKHKGCGWCDKESKCLPGTGHGPDVSINAPCTSWFYHQCLTVDGSVACSDQISVMPCATRYCNSNATEKNNALCQQCQDLQNCYTSAALCQTWDEAKCPNGRPVTNYDDPTRIVNTQFKSDVHVLSNQTMYLCPYTVRKNSIDNLFITVEKGLKKDKIMLGVQCGGIMHRVKSVTDINKYQFVVGRPVGLNDVISYADFKQTVSADSTQDEVTVEETLDEDLLSSILLKKNSLSETFHEINETNYKCIGHLYSNGNVNDFTRTYYVVIEQNSFLDDIHEGDIIASNKSDGFLEDVTSQKSIDIGTVAHTTLSRCNAESVRGMTLNLEWSKRDMACQGGDNWPGLLYWERKANADINGTTVVGRKSGPVLGKVMNKFTTKGYAFFEVLPVSGLDDETLYFNGNVTHVKKHFRVRRSLKSLLHRISGTLDIGIPRASIKPNIVFNPTLDVMINMKWDWSKLKFDYKASAAFSGTVGASLDAQLKFSAGFESNIRERRKFFKKPTPFIIPIGPIPLPCLWWVQGKWGGKVSFKAGGTLSWRIGASVDFAVGAATAGLPKPPNYVKTSGHNNFDGALDEAEASFSFNFKPSIHAACPAHPFVFDLDPENPEKRDFIPVSVSDKIGGVEIKVTDRDSITSLEVSLGLPSSAQVFLKACSTNCKEPTKLLEIGGKIGFNAIELILAAFTKNLEISKPISLGWTPSKCFGQEQECCICEETGDAGQLDPKTKECLCKCECEAPDGTKVPSFKKKDEECMCDFCPDDKTLERWNEDIKCPCACKDGEEKEQEPDGTCDCRCLCEDGTEDEIDEDGNCPCECECKNCEKSKRAADGECDCPNDKCPVCEDGSDGDWVNCECKCPEPDCGNPPICAAGRRGPSCDLPNCPGCQGCSGRGTCTLESKCAASCVCNRRWTGNCCERRNPNNNWGDPHMETLDGISFDYFGIGQFWYCKSFRNDFGYQVRYFYYKQTSFTGAVAIKAGYSVATLTTQGLNNRKGAELPILRIDGSVIDLGLSRKIMLSNSTVTVDIQPKQKIQTDIDDPAVVMVSFEFKAGATVSLDVRYSPTMGRQYLNIMFTPTVAFLSKTQGLCGPMDDDETNDLMGPDGNIFTDTTKFTESWRIPVLNRDNGGVYGSWSWSETNFHKDDIPDISYTDPNFTPAYTLDVVSGDVVSQATSICNSLGIKDAKLDGCIFDIVITNDTSFAKQESLQTGCPSQCSGKGRCLIDTCVCLEGWSGPDCSEGACGTCFHGDCVSGFCQCNVGWEGPECDIEATCFGVNNCTDAFHGRCDKLDKCLCVEGFTGTNCSLEATCFNNDNCSGNGTCVEFDLCNCNLGYAGANCTQFSCQSLDHCSGHGNCTAFDECLCDAGWTGRGCGSPDCTGLNDCSDNGRCIHPNKCQCNDGYIGSNCSEFRKCPQLQNCHGNGLCIKSQNGGFNCSCFDGFYGDNCDTANCSSLNECSGHGNCTEPELCSCETGYALPNCGKFSCETLNSCSDHGRCVEFETCQCDVGWTGPGCNTPNCSSLNDCHGKGLCLTPDKCDCFNGYENEDCSVNSPPNINPPVFNETQYNVIIFENTKSGTSLVNISGYDIDTGGNGRIRYSMNLAGVVIDVARYLMIDNLSGQITIIESLSHEVLPTGMLTISIIISDKGSPQLSDTAVLTIKLYDRNDHCPVFSTPSEDDIISVNTSVPVNSSVVSIKTNDADIGLGGQVLYSLVNNTDLFGVDQEVGAIYVQADPLPTGNYSLTIVASDQGLKPCQTNVTVVIMVYNSTEPIDSTTTTMSP